MAKRQDIYKCESCGNVTELLVCGSNITNKKEYDTAVMAGNIVSADIGGGGELVCCDAPMKLMIENTVDAAKEKHVPVVEMIDIGVRAIKVKVGSVAHPMEAAHFIEWIEITSGGKTCRQFLNPGDVPEATFLIEGKSVSVRASCNLHGLWKS